MQGPQIEPPDVIVRSVLGVIGAVRIRSGALVDDVEDLIPAVRFTWTGAAPTITPTTAPEHFDHFLLSQ